MTQAPTPGLLSAEDVKLLVKLLDTLKPFAEVAEKLKHCHVVEICEPTPDNPSRNIIPMPREWFERAGDDLEYIAIQLHASGVLSEGQASKITGLDRVEVRREVDRLAPTAPVEASRSELADAVERVDRWANYPYTYADTVAVDSPLSTFTAGDLRLILAALSPQPSGETREDDLVEMLSDWFERIPGFQDTGEGTIKGRYPTGFQDVEFGHIALAKDILALLSARPLALGGQHSTATDFPPDDVLACVSDTTPARAEAQDEGAAGEPVAWRETFIVEEEDGAAVGIVIDLPDGSQIWTGECSTQLLEDAKAREESPEASGQYLIVAAKGEPTRVIAQVATVDDGIALARAISGHAPAHPSPTPAADADRVRIAVEALEPFALLAPSEVSNGVNMADPLSKWFTVAQLERASNAIVTLKSTAAKEGGE